MDFLQTNEVTFETLMPIIKERLANGISVWIYPKGVSMRPMIRQGVDRVLLSPVPEKLQKYDLPFYQRDNGQFVLHRIVRAGETYTCVGDNQVDLETGVRHDQMIAIVTAFTRGNREVSVNSFWYKVYCRYCHYFRHPRHIWRRGIGWLRRRLR